MGRSSWVLAVAVLTVTAAMAGCGENEQAGLSDDESERLLTLCAIDMPALRCEEAVDLFGEAGCDYATSRRMLLLVLRAYEGPASGVPELRRQVVEMSQECSNVSSS